MGWTSLGCVVVPTPGTPVNATANVDFTSTAFKNFGSKVGTLSCAAILFQAFHLNSGKSYAGDRPNFNVTTGVGMLVALGKPTQNTIPSGGASPPGTFGTLNAAEYWVDVEVGGDGVLVSVLIL